MEVNSLLNNREFQEVLQEYFQGNSMTLDEFLENLPRFMMENYGLQDDDEEEDNEDEEEELFLEDEELDLSTLNDRDFTEFMHRIYRQESNQNEYGQVLMRAILAGRRERENNSEDIPMRNILPNSPPPSPVPNIVNTAASIPFFQRNRRLVPPQLPTRPANRNSFLRRTSSQLGNSVTSHSSLLNQRFDPNGPSEDFKSSPSPTPSAFSPIDRNNDLPLTSEYLRTHQSHRPRLIDDAPER